MGRGRRVLWLAVLLLAAPVLHGAGLRVEAAKAALELGRPLPVTVTFQGAEDPGFVDYQPWREDFFVEPRDRVVERGAAGVRVTEQVRAYPRRSGRLKLHALRHGGALSRPVAVTVTPPVHDGVDATPRVAPLPAAAWEGEAVDLTVTVPLLHPRNEVTAGELELPGFTVHALPPIKRQGGGHGEVVLRWRLFGNDAGLHMLELPAIVQRGKGRWRFHPPLATLEVRPLPAYLPASVPVGALTVTGARVEAAGGPRWRVSVASPGRLPAEVWGLRRRLAELGRTTVAAVTVATRTGAEAAMVQVYEVAVPRWSWDLGAGSQVTVPYFHPQRGALVEATIQLPAVWRLPSWARGLVLAAVAVAVAGAAWRARGVVRRWRHRRRLRRALGAAADPHVLRRLLLSAAGRRTLASWAEAAGGDDAEDVARRLNAACFSPRGHERAEALRRDVLGLRLPCGGR